MIIAIPSKVYIMRPKKDYAVVGGIGGEQYNIYFRNVILPFKDEYDIKIKCDYGANYGEFWRIEEFPYDTDSFPLKISVYDAGGTCIAEKETTIIMTEKNQAENYDIMAIGDSMTHACVYPAHVMHKLENLHFKGTRSFDGQLFTEGRGGWTYDAYFLNNTICWGGVSPFLFPKGVDDYYGDIDFENMKKSDNKPAYSYDGFAAAEPHEGQIYHKDGMLYKFGTAEPVNKKPEWEFNFGKYMAKNRIGHIDAVSLFMGGNDLQIVEYEESEKVIAHFIENIQKVTDSIKKYDDKIKIIINLPVIGAEQFAWGKRMKCTCTSKQYRYNVIHAAQAIIDNFENRSGIYLSSSLLNLDPVYGFDLQPYKANIYSDAYIMRHANWVHPNRTGYMQIGDSLAAAIEYIRSIR